VAKTPTEAVIQIKNVRKSYGKLQVLKNISFSVPKGQIVALLGPNGAGKTTLVKMMSTLLSVDKGSIVIESNDVMKDPSAVRSLIGLTGQYAAVDEYLTGEENLVMMGHLYRLDKKTAKQRAKELLKQFDLAEAGKRAVRTYSGGMRRRLDLAASLIAAPPVIFLDEPTTGLDPSSRLTMWSIIKELVAGGTTILLTTQYLDEADQLANNIIVIDKGVVIAEGTADQLKKKVGGERLKLELKNEKQVEEAREIFAKFKPVVGNKATVITMPASGIAQLTTVLEMANDNKIQLAEVALERPTLDDVFLTLTGHVASKETNDTESQKGDA
jgi:ABC-2 type transport system ATP-binding protein